MSPEPEIEQEEEEDIMNIVSKAKEDIKKKDAQTARQKEEMKKRAMETDA